MLSNCRIMENRDKIAQIAFPGLIRAQCAFTADWIVQFKTYALALIIQQVIIHPQFASAADGMGYSETVRFRHLLSL
jgi:hypothetical protein